MDATPYTSSKGGKRIHRSMYDMEETIAVMPGIQRYNLGQEMVVNHPTAAKYNLLVAGITYTMDETGVTTRLALRSTVYYYPTAGN